MRFVLMIAPLLALAACNRMDAAEAIPKARDVEAIEQQLSKAKCVGDIVSWERQYQYLRDVNVRSASIGKVDQNVIAFALHRGSSMYPIKPGRLVLPANKGFMGGIDDRPGDYATGRFDMRTRKLMLTYCGPSEGG